MATQQDYRIELDSYSGPLDLLLFLVKRNEVDLNDIPISDLTEQYLDYLKELKNINVDVAGEFLVMAATLLEIKSRMIMPLDEVRSSEGGDDPETIDPIDPRFELVQQLLAYKRFKDAAFELEDLKEQWYLRFPHLPAKIKRKVASVEVEEEVEGDEDAEGEVEELALDLEDANILDLCKAFEQIMDSVGHASSRHEVVYDDTPISLHAADIVDRLKREGMMTLQDIFVGRANRSEMVGLFLATLELVKDKKVGVTQLGPGEPIHINLRHADAQVVGDNDEATDWTDPETGQMQYDWPDVEAKRRFERRQAMRFKRLEEGKSEDEVEEELGRDAGESLDSEVSGDVEESVDSELAEDGGESLDSGLDEEVVEDEGEE